MNVEEKLKPELHSEYATTAVLSIANGFHARVIGEEKDGSIAMGMTYVFFASFDWKSQK